MKLRDRALFSVLMILIAALGIYAWRQHVAVVKAENEVAMNTTRMLHEIFIIKGDLRVGQLKGVVLSNTENDGWIFKTSQITRAPTTVNYLLDIGKAKTGNFLWDADHRALTIEIPDVSVEPPAVDMAQAEVRQDGIWISRAAGQNLQKQAAARIAARATQRAQSDENIAKARVAARSGVATFVQKPLRAIGFGDVDVRVVFPWEGRRSPEQWERSRNLEDVAANRF